MDGLLVIDKPAGPTSHDVVARVRRALRQRRVGHTGTLDPMATGVLPLVVGRATRLARFIGGADKGYRAVIRLGVRTESGDAEGEPVGEAWAGAAPPAAAIDAALDGFRGAFLQHPPAFSAKKIGGRRSYAIARSGGAARPDPVSVSVDRLTIAALDGDRLTLDLNCSAGFYVRALADDLGQRLGTGAHLTELRRTSHGEFTLSDAIPLASVEQDPAAAAERLIPLGRLLTALAAVTLTPEGVTSATHGRELTPAFWTLSAPAAEAPATFVRLLSPGGDLVGIARPSGAAGLLHPFVVLM